MKFPLALAALALCTTPHLFSEAVAPHHCHYQIILPPIPSNPGNTSFWDLNLGGMYLDYKETFNGEELDSVHSWFPTANVIFSTRCCPLFFEGEFSYAFGDGTYRGRVWEDDSDSLPSIKASSQHQFFSAQAMLGCIGGYLWGVEWIPVIAGGKRVWIREVPPAASISGISLNSYTETYTHYMVSLGIRANHCFSSCGMWRSTLLLGTTLSPNMRTSLPFPEVGTIFINAPLGNRFWGSWDLYFAYGWCGGYLVVGGQVQTFSYGRSANIVSEIDLFEPDSTTVQGNLTIGWQRCF